ncbi:hypothetical protein SISSUDRAFT_458101 [Sistotremastrum suecicum HHB10207 ss-3]|uniref:Uncharacterized protein n=1 Tax=Sistotremastrum suecicum HHB10207 ss-3 TaxID=1314776 RepID=A0A165Y7B7_9AGAM|nr:hypothetical protein SISSUDRAFT_458101 [Sistotremastrum suecicum HHB10207 ss-3]
MILMEGDTVSTYQYLEHLSGLEYLWERQRILCEFVVRSQEMSVLSSPTCHRPHFVISMTTMVPG